MSRVFFMLFKADQFLKVIEEYRVLVFKYNILMLFLDLCIIRQQLLLQLKIPLLTSVTFWSNPAFLTASITIFSVDITARVQTMSTLMLTFVTPFIVSAGCIIVRQC
jgi:hypothetical protein